MQALVSPSLSSCFHAYLLVCVSFHFFSFLFPFVQFSFCPLSFATRIQSATYSWDQPKTSHTTTTNTTSHSAHPSHRQLYSTPLLCAPCVLPPPLCFPHACEWVGDCDVGPGDGPRRYNHSRHTTTKREKVRTIKRQQHTRSNQDGENTRPKMATLESLCDTTVPDLATVNCVPLIAMCVCMCPSQSARWFVLL